MIIKLTLHSEMGYKPIYTTIEIEGADYYRANRARILQEGIAKICIKRGHTTPRELRTKYGYTKVTIENHDPSEWARNRADKRAAYKATAKQMGLS